MIMIRTVKSKQQHFPAVHSSRVVKRRIYATCITIIFGIEKICAAATWAGVCVWGPNSRARQGAFCASQGAARTLQNTHLY
jgi:hypothetical protein